MQPLIKRIEALESTTHATNLWAWRYSGESLDDVLKRIDAEPQANVIIFSWQEHTT